MLPWFITPRSWAHPRQLAIGQPQTWTRTWWKNSFQFSLTIFGTCKNRQLKKDIQIVSTTSIEASAASWYHAWSLWIYLSLHPSIYEPCCQCICSSTACGSINIYNCIMTKWKETCNTQRTYNLWTLPRTNANGIPTNEGSVTWIRTCFGCIAPCTCYTV